jgi:hypothetical protein
MAAAAIGALVYAFFQVRAARNDAHDQTAKEIWKEYHIKGLEYPEFSNPEKLLKNWDYAEENKLDGSHEKFLKYTWFVSFLLLVCDEILRLRHGSNWDQIVTNNLEWHKVYLTSEAFERDEYEVQSPKLRAKIRALNDRPAVVVKVGDQHTATMTLTRRRFRATHIRCQWSPTQPINLTKKEKLQYRIGREDAVVDAFMGRRVGLIIDQGTPALKRSKSKWTRPWG